MQALRQDVQHGQRPRPQPQEEKPEEAVSAAPVPFEKVISWHTHQAYISIACSSTPQHLRSRTNVCISPSFINREYSDVIVLGSGLTMCPCDINF